LNEIGDGDDVGHRVFALNDPASKETPLSNSSIGEGPTSPMRSSRGYRSTAPSPIAATGITTDPPPPPIELAPTPAVPPADYDPMEPTLETIDTKRVREMSQAPAPVVSSARRTRGIAIAVVLLALLAVYGTWYALRTVKKVQPDPKPTTVVPQAAPKP
jgi:hypothetical protein